MKDVPIALGNERLSISPALLSAYASLTPGERREAKRLVNSGERFQRDTPLDRFLALIDKTVA